VSDDAARVIAQLLKWKMAVARSFIAALEHRGVHVIYRPTTGELCPCGYHEATESGLCVSCETERELERQREKDAEEHERLEAERERQINSLKKQRERSRRALRANPRDTEARHMIQVVEELLEYLEGGEAAEPEFEE
jgi:hypothetical protein